MGSIISFFLGHDPLARENYMGIYTKKVCHGGDWHVMRTNLLYGRIEEAESWLEKELRFKKTSIDWIDFDFKTIISSSPINHDDVIVKLNRKSDIEAGLK